jgi:secreted trypsin-like serine protease
LNDIAILKLSQNVTLNEYIQIACLPKSQSNTYPGTNIPGWIVGWGTTNYGGSESNLLRNAKITIYDSSKCNSVLPAISKNWYSQICAGELSGGKDTCQGDSGGWIFIVISKI